MKLRELTIKGMSSLEKDLIKYREKESPTLNIKNYESKPIDSNIDIDEKKIFSSKFDVGQYFLVSLSDHIPNPGVWNWLSLVYYKQFFNKKNKIGEIQRLFIPSLQESFYPTSHLLMPPYDICKFYKDDLDKIDFLLSGPANMNAVLYREIVKRNDIVRNINFIKVARKLFYDSKRERIKPVRVMKKSILRLIKVYKQYERGFDMYHMPSDKMIEIILKKHKEFDIFLK